MDAGVFAVDAANRSLLYSHDFIKDETPATLCSHRLLPPHPLELRVQALRSDADLQSAQLCSLKIFSGGTTDNSCCTSVITFCQASFYLYNESADFSQKVRYLFIILLHIAQKCNTEISCQGKVSLFKYEETVLSAQFFERSDCMAVYSKVRKGVRLQGLRP